MKYSIIIPALEEELRIGNTLDRLAKTIKDNVQEYEIIVVVAESRDKTAKIVKVHQKHMKNLHLIEPGRRVGKGRDVAAGMKAAKGDYRLFMDADLATPLKYLPKIFSLLESKKADVVIGVRDLSSIHKGGRKQLSFAWNLLSRHVLKLEFKDTQCGFKGFTAKASQDIFPNLTIEKWLFDMELLVIANSNNFKITELRIDDWKNQPDGTFGKRIILDAVSSFNEFLTIANNVRVGKYQEEQR